MICAPAVRVTMGRDGPGVIHSFLGGLLFTLILVVAVPVVTTALIEPRVVEFVGDTSIAVLTSSTIVTLIMLAVMVVTMLLLGGGAVLRKYGVIGVIGLVAAYWIMGNVYDAVIPVIVLVLIWLITGRKKD